MTSASLETNVQLLRGVVPEAVAEPFKTALTAQISRFRRLGSLSRARSTGLA